MSRHYSIKSFFRNIPNALLQRYFARKELFTDLDFKDLKEGNPESLFTEWVKLPPKQRQIMETDFQDIFALSTDKGADAIADEARHQFRREQPSLLNEFMDWFASLNSHYERAMRVFLDYHQYWNGATHFFHADTLSHWRKGKGFIRTIPRYDVDSLQQLATAISDYYHYHEGKGKNCKVEPFLRQHRHYFFAYPEDYSHRNIEWVNGDFQPRSHNPAFEIIFVYSPEEGSLDINYRGNKKHLKPLQSFFNQIILAEENLPTDMIDTRVYELTDMLARDFEFKIPSDSPVKDMLISSVRINNVSSEGDSMILQADCFRNPDHIHHLLAGIKRGYPHSEFHISRVECLALLQLDPDKSAKRHRFTITLPNSCSLKYDKAGLLLREVLQQSGIEPRELPETQPLLSDIKAD